MRLNAKVCVSCESSAAHGVFPIRMACPLCGDRCTCSAASTGKQIAGTRVSVLVDPNDDTQNSDRSTASENFSRAKTTAARNPAGDNNQGDWRGEVANRVQAHRARRRRRYDPESSLSLSFTQTAAASSDSAESSPEKSKHASQQYHASSSAPELEPSSSDFESAGGVSTLIGEIEDSRPSPYRRIVMKVPEQLEACDTADNVIEFPRSVEQDLLFATELAETISATPRILESEPPEAAVTTEPSPAKLQPLATFHLDDYISSVHADDWEQQEAEESDGGIELPLQVAPANARTMCALTDAVVVFTASALFAVIVLSIAKFVPQGRLAVALALLLPLGLWSAYHYVFLVYGGATVGMQMAQLELTSFEGCVPPRRIRAWRALSLLLSCASLGLGFAWAMVDEDRLGWHDRITRTYLRRS
jgi:uncharacterized RDD family membrane protein YckC